MLRKPPSAVPYVNIKKDGDKIRGIVFDTGSNGGISIPLKNRTASEQSVQCIDQSTQGLFGAGTDTLYISDDQTVNQACKTKGLLD